MHIRTISKDKPGVAFNVELGFDLFLQFLAIVEALERITGIEIRSFIKGTTT